MARKRKRQTVNASLHEPPIKKSKLKNLHVNTLKEVELKGVQFELAVSYVNKNTPVKPEPNIAAASTVALGSDNNGVHVLRAKRLYRKVCHICDVVVDFEAMTLDETIKRRTREEGHNSAMGETTSVKVNSRRDISGIALSAKQLKDETYAEIIGVTSKSRFQIRQKKSDCNFEEGRAVGGDEDAVPFNKTVDSNTETKNVLRCANYGKNILVSGSNPDEQNGFQNTNGKTAENKGTQRRGQFKLKRENRVGPAPKRSRVTKMTSDSLKDSEVFVLVPGSITSNVLVCPNLLKTNDIFCPETGESGCARPGQPLASISGDSFKSCPVSVMSSSVCAESSSTSFNIAGCSAAQSTDLSSQTKTNPPTTSELPSKYPNTSLNELVGKRIVVTESSKPQSSARLESTLSTKIVDCVLYDKGEASAMKHLSVPQTNKSDKNTDKELLPGDVEGNSMILEAEEHVLQQTDDLLNDLMEDSTKKPLAVSYTEQGNKDFDKELLPGDIKDSSVILDAEVDILQHIDDLLNDLTKDSALKTLAVSHTEHGKKDFDKELLPGDVKDNSVILEDEERVLQLIDNYLNDLTKERAVKPLAASYTEHGKKDIDKELLPGDIKDNSVILDAVRDIPEEIDDLLNGFTKDSAMNPLAVSCTEQGDRDLDKKTIAR
jgi:hypothetical protein